MIAGSLTELTLQLAFDGETPRPLRGFGKAMVVWRRHRSSLSSFRLATASDVEKSIFGLLTDQANGTAMTLQCLHS
jgi:hypothetical protein